MVILIRGRFIRNWVFIAVIVLVFISGNYVLYKSFNGNTKPRRRDKPSNSVQPLNRVEEFEPTIDFTVERDGKEEERITEKRVEKEVLSTSLAIKPTATITNSKFKYKIGILVIACNRPSVSRCLDQIFKLKPQNIDIPVVVSQDCGHAETESVIKSYGNKLTLYKQPDLSDVQGVPNNMQHFMGYYKISRHYKFALQQAFKDPKIDSVIVIEDDLTIGNMLSICMYVCMYSIFKVNNRVKLKLVYNLVH